MKQLLVFLVVVWQGLFSMDRMSLAFINDTQPVPIDNHVGLNAAPKAEKLSPKSESSRKTKQKSHRSLPYENKGKESSINQDLEELQALNQKLTEIMQGTQQYDFSNEPLATIYNNILQIKKFDGESKYKKALELLREASEEKRVQITDDLIVDVLCQNGIILDPQDPRFLSKETIGLLADLRYLLDCLGMYSQFFDNTIKTEKNSMKLSASDKRIMRAIDLVHAKDERSFRILKAIFNEEKVEISDSALIVDTFKDQNIELSSKTDFLISGLTAHLTDLKKKKPNFFKDLEIKASFN